MKNPPQPTPKLSQDIIDVLKKKYIIMIVGDMGSGKTTESCIITTSLGRNSAIFAQHDHEPDKKLHKQHNIQRHIVDGSHIKSVLDKKTDSILIFDDYYSANFRQKANVNRIINDLRKRNLQVILIYHGDSIRSHYLKDSGSIFVVKRNSGLNKNKFKKYFDVEQISSVAAEYCKKITGYDSVYIFKDGKYYHMHSNSGKITSGIFKPKLNVNVDTEKLKKYLLKDKLNQRKTADKLGVSLSKIQREIKKLKKIDNEFAESLKKTVKVKVSGGISKKGKKIKSGLSLHIEVEKLKIIGGKPVRTIAQMNKIQDIGDFATEVIGDAIYNKFKDIVKKNLISYVDITIRNSTGGTDIEIEKDNKTVEIEIKNYKITPNKKHLTPFYIKKRVLNRYKYNNSEKWLFTCGRPCDKKSKKILKAKKINYKKLTNKQLLKGQKDRKYHIKKKMHKFVSNL